MDIRAQTNDSQKLQTLSIIHTRSTIITHIIIYRLEHCIQYVITNLLKFKGALSAIIVNLCSPQKLSDMIDALIKRVSVTYKCYEMYVHRGKNVQLLVF